MRPHLIQNKVTRARKASPSIASGTIAGLLGMALLTTLGCQGNDVSPTSTTDTSMTEASAGQDGFAPGAPGTDGLENDIRKTLFRLIDAMENKDIDLYTKLFDPDEFEFRFDPGDVAGNPDIPGSWGWRDDRASTKNMFDSSLVLEIELDYQVSGPVQSEPADEAPENTFKVQVTDVDLTIDTVDPEGGENIVYKVAGDRATFFLDPSFAKEHGGTEPRIVQWRDERVGARSGFVELISWGGIKNIYR